MYVVRNGPVNHQARSVQGGKLSRPIFICCGSVGIVLTVLGGIILGVGHQKLKDVSDYTYILVGSIALGFGLILTILAIFLSVSWASLGSTDYEPTTSATPGVSVSVHVDGEDLELDGLEAQSSKR